MKENQTQFENTNQYIYLIHPREHIRLSEPVYKIGISTQDHFKTFNQLPKDSHLICMIEVIDCIQFENKLIEVFKNKFKQRTDFGRKYFEGDEKLMVKTIVNESINFDIEENKRIIEERKQVIEEKKIKKERRKREKEQKREKLRLKKIMKIEKEIESVRNERLIIESICNPNINTQQNDTYPLTFESPINRKIYHI